MPELPEVETIRRDLTARIVGRTVVEAWVSPDAPKLVQGETPESFRRRLVGRAVEELDRRGKYLLLRLDGGLTWIVHLRMTGGLIHMPAGGHGARNDGRDDRFLRARFRLDDGGELCDRPRLHHSRVVDQHVHLVGERRLPVPLVCDVQHLDL